MSWIAYVALFVSFAVVALKVIAPMTKTKLDDEALALLEKIEPHLTDAELEKLKSLVK